LRKPNYSFEKRQRELAKQKKREAKRQRKQEQDPDAAEGTEGTSETPSDS